MDLDELDRFLLANLQHQGDGRNPEQQGNELLSRDFQDLIDGWNDDLHSASLAVEGDSPQPLADARSESGPSAVLPILINTTFSLPPTKVEWGVQPPQEGYVTSQQFLGTPIKQNWMDVLEKMYRDQGQVEDDDDSSSSSGGGIYGVMPGGEDIVELKDEDDSSSSASQKKKKRLTPEEKLTKRRHHIKIASRIYRKRKRDLENHLMEQIDKLEEEKKRVAEQHKAAAKLADHLRRENEAMKAASPMKSLRNQTKRNALIQHLGQQVIDGVDDHRLLDTIKEIKDSCRSCLTYGQCHLDELLCPNVVEQLINSGFFSETGPCTPTLLKKGGVPDIQKKMIEEIKSLSDEQKNRMDKVVKEHMERLRFIHDERAELTASFSQLFSHLRGEAPDMSRFVKIAASVEHLRENLHAESSEMGNTLHQLVDQTLTPLQHAQFFLKVEFIHASVQQLNTVWSALNKTWAGSGLSAIQLNQRLSP